MVIRNNILGGEDFKQDEPKLLATDLNDTINEIVRIVNNGYTE